MNYLKKYIKLLSGISAAIIIVTMLHTYVFAASGTVNESESNDTFSTADRTYDDYNSYGYISSNSDNCDYWVYTATYTGSANIWLGNIPSGCNYNIYLYNGSHSYMAVSMLSSGTQEIIYARLVSGQTYYIKITRASGYSTSQAYNLRIKNYPIGNSNLYTFNYTDSNGNILNTVPSATNSTSYLSNMGYNTQNNTNHAASSAYSSIQSSRVFVFNGHANSQLLEFYNGSSYIYAQNNYSTSLSQLSSTSLSNSRLILFAGCYTSSDNSTNDFVDIALSKGASCAIGWPDTNKVGGWRKWIPLFFYYCSQGKNVAGAMEATDADLINDSYFGNLGQHVDGDSRPASIII